MPGSERRLNPRAHVELGCALHRERGRGVAISARTVDIGAGGMCVRCDRPLAPDELVTFTLPLGGGEPVDGAARVMRMQAPRIYALRFERLASAAQGRIEAAVSAELSRA